MSTFIALFVGALAGLILCAGWFVVSILGTRAIAEEEALMRGGRECRCDRGVVS